MKSMILAFAIVGLVLPKGASALECRYYWESMWELVWKDSIRVSVSSQPNPYCEGNSCLTVTLAENYDRKQVDQFEFSRTTVLESASKESGILDITFSVQQMEPIQFVVGSPFIATEPVDASEVMAFQDKFPIYRRVRLTTSGDGRGLLTDLDRYEACQRRARRINEMREWEREYRYPMHCE